MIARALNGRRVLRLWGAEVGLHNLSVAAALSLATMAVVLWSLSSGQTQMGTGTVLAALTGAEVTPDQAYAIFEVRLPRVILGFMAGWAVALAGAMLQSLARNPLADPGLLGLSQGALVAILVLTVAFPTLPRNWLPFAAFAGGLGVALTILALIGRNRSSGMAILLMGIAVETVLSGVTSILILYTPPEQSYALAAWMAGSLAGAGWSGIATMAPWFALGLVAIALLGRALALYDLGDQMAMALGEDVARSRPLILIAAVFLTSAALTAVGPLMFLGVMGPHIAAMLSPATGRMRLALSALVGGLLTITADLVTRTATQNIALPVGLSLVIIGAPLFIITMRLRLLSRASSN